MNKEELTIESIYEFPPESSDVLAKAAHFHERFKVIKERGEYTYRRTMASGSGPHVMVRDDLGKEREMIMFASNNYLGLAQDPRVVKAAQAAGEKYGYGSGSVALLSGTTALHKELEASIADFYQCEAACVFPTGYQANVATIQSLLTHQDVAVSDMYAHASIIDGVILSDGTLKYFQHNDLPSLERLLKRLSKHFLGKLVVTDGVFSMDGDVTPLAGLMKIAKEHDARVLIDEAHALGIIGPTGRGTAEHFGLQGKVDLTIGTLSKAPSSIGGYLTGRADVVEYVRHFGRAYIFSTTFPPAVAAGLLEVFNLLRRDHTMREKLQTNVDYFVTKVEAMGFDTLGSRTAIIPVMVSDDIKLRQVCSEMHEAGLFVNPVTFPAVAKGRSRIRVSLMASHSKEDLDKLLTVLATMDKKYKLT